MINFRIYILQITASIMADDINANWQEADNTDLAVEVAPLNPDDCIEIDLDKRFSVCNRPDTDYTVQVPS